jgi:hypothetical protein
MTISKELFLAVLAMDSYHRGYDAGLAGGADGNSERRVRLSAPFTR